MGTVTAASRCVDRVPLVQHGAQPAARVAGDHHPGPVQADAPGDGAELGGQVDHGQPVEQGLDAGVEDRAAAEGQHAAVGAQRAERAA